ncbi:hypothetical protein [Burkholderia gladioli]|uniref:hypothetical protein n=1 Tax=Burkholderia gladioli TaxID=28095 RepID=UPI00163F5BEC|nr:hypothetical protein [Burkholderia gladioli]MDN7805770.1 hypothetical protein [Burkholderia gladioli]
MGSVGMFLARLLAQAFPGGPQNLTAAPSTSSVPAERTVGSGAANETFVTIGGVAHLFVDEGDCVVEFAPAFDEAPGDTMFGTKILPALAPHWALKHEHSVPLKEAIAIAIRRGSAPASPPLASTSTSSSAVADRRPAPPLDASQSAHRGESAGRRGSSTHESSLGRNRAVGHDYASRSSVDKGRISGWGEREFLDRRPGVSRTYRSFALCLDTSNGERVLQGEGLKEAIAECGCHVGDTVVVKRLRKIKVAAYREDDGTPIYKNGQQVMWDKWLWSITK